MPRRVAPAATSATVSPHPIDPMVDELADRAASVTDPRLKQVLLRAACTVVDRTLDRGTLLYESRLNGGVTTDTTLA